MVVSYQRTTSWKDREGLRTLSLLDALVIHINRDIPRTQGTIVDALWREDAKAAFCLTVIWNITIYHMKCILPVEILSVISCNKIQAFILRKLPKQGEFYIIGLPLALMTSFKLIHMKGTWQCMIWVLVKKEEANLMKVVNKS